MRFYIEHDTIYHYSAPVFLEPHCFRFQPRSGPAQHVRHSQLEISPTPQARSDFLDAEGNSVAAAWFAGTTSQLELRVRIEATTLRRNPFDFLPNPDSDELPLAYPAEVLPFLAPYLKRSSAAPAIDALARTIADEVSGQTSPFLNRLVEKLYADIHYVQREEGPPLPPEQTLASGQGTCRDTAVVFMEACRSVGLAARFVSGYQEGDPDQDARDLHAWAEVYLPGGGWRGYDPTHGLAVADRHVAVAASASAAGAASLTGSFRKTGATSKMETRLALRVEPDED